MAGVAKTSLSKSLLSIASSAKSVQRLPFMVSSLRNASSIAPASDRDFSKIPSAKWVDQPTNFFGLQMRLSSVPTFKWLFPKRSFFSYNTSTDNRHLAYHGLIAK